MKTIKLKDEQVERLTRLLTKRIEVQRQWMQKPEDFARSMWPITVDAEMIAKNKADYNKRQKTIDEYTDILAKLGRAK